jgi:hypothetical protein
MLIFLWFLEPGFAGAGDGSRTRDNQLGRLELYQLSYSREFLILLCDVMGVRFRDKFRWVRCGGGRIRTFEANSDRFTVCSLWPLGNPSEL